MAKKVIAQTTASDAAQDGATDEGLRAPQSSPVREYDLIGDIVFDPPLPPEELRRRFGYGIPIEERIEQVRRQLAEGIDWSYRADGSRSR